MADDPQLLTGASILRLLRHVADRLPVQGPRPSIILAGGSLLAVAGLRQTTRDADSVRRMTDALYASARDVAALYDLEPTWLNDRAAPFAPVTLREQDCTLLLDHPRLLVLGAPLRQVFLMKMYARRPIDLLDLQEMWPLCQFTSVPEAVGEFYAGYPWRTKTRTSRSG
jgi:hypothetical protein